MPWLPLTARKPSKLRSPFRKIRPLRFTSARARARVDRLEGIVRGFAAAARESSCALVGGNLSAGLHWMISVALVGEPFAIPLRRSGARAGDHLYVSGVLGAAGFGREILLGRRRG